MKTFKLAQLLAVVLLFVVVGSADASVEIAVLALKENATKI